MLYTQVAVLLVLAVSCRASPLPQAQSYSLFTPGLSGSKAPLALSEVPLAISQAPTFLSHAPALISHAPVLVSQAPTLVSHAPVALHQPAEIEHYVSKLAISRNVELVHGIISTMVFMAKYTGRQTSIEIFNRKGVRNFSSKFL